MKSRKHQIIQHRTYKHIFQYFSINVSAEINYSMIMEISNTYERACKNVSNWLPTQSAKNSNYVQGGFHFSHLGKGWWTWERRLGGSSDRTNTLKHPGGLKKWEKTSMPQIFWDINISIGLICNSASRGASAAAASISSIPFCLLNKLILPWKYLNRNLNNLFITRYRLMEFFPFGISFHFPRFFSHILRLTSISHYTFFNHTR